MAFYLSNAASDQDSLLGKWQLLEMQRDSVKVFDRYDWSVSLDARFKKAYKTTDSISTIDSNKIGIRIADSLEESESEFENDILTLIT
ncbi:MAG: hypothetical protein ACI8ZN_001085 [Bacteroidia bacterium]